MPFGSFSFLNENINGFGLTEQITELIRPIDVGGIGGGSSSDTALFNNCGHHGGPADHDRIYAIWFSVILSH